MSLFNQKKKRKYILNLSKRPESECRVKDCHKDKTLRFERQPPCYCDLHWERIIMGEYRKQEERIADILMVDQKESTLDRLKMRVPR